MPAITRSQIASLPAQPPASPHQDDEATLLETENLMQDRLALCRRHTEILFEVGRILRWIDENLVQRHDEMLEEVLWQKAHEDMHAARREWREISKELKKNKKSLSEARQRDKAGS